MDTRTDYRPVSTQRTIGTAAVDGLIAGSAAGIAMVVCLLPITGESPDVLFDRFAVEGMQTSSATGIVGHLAVSAIYGMIFGVLWNTFGHDHSRLKCVIGGLVYSLIIFSVAEWVILPAVQSPLLTIPVVPFFIAHLIYGLILGATLHLERNERH